MPNEFNEANLGELVQGATELTTTPTQEGQPQPAIPRLQDDAFLVEQKPGGQLEVIDVPTEDTPPVAPTPQQASIPAVPDVPETGLIIETKKPEPEPEQPATAIPGVRAEVADSISKYIGEMEETIEGEKQIAAERGFTEEQVHQSVAAGTIPTPEDGQTDDEGNAEVSFEEKYQESIVYIDKTGMGVLINFTPEEQEKLERSNVIKLKEVETVDLKSLKHKKAKKSVLGKILKRKLTVHETPIVATSSGYTATMAGASTYQLIALMDSSKNEVIDAERKWGLIHDKITESSLGKMDFNEFLTKTSSLDYSTFIYGLLTATYPNDDTIPVDCPKCGAVHDHKYSVKSLIRGENIGPKMQALIADIVDSSHMEHTAREAHSRAPINMVNTIVLPESGFAVDLQIQSAHDLIYKSIKELSKDADSLRSQANVLSTAIRAIYIEDPDDAESHLMFDEVDDIREIIFNLANKDIMVLSSQAQDFMNDITFDFGLMNVKCPKCNHHRESVPFDIESILFFQYQRELNTTVE